LKDKFADFSNHFPAASRKQHGNKEKAKWREQRGDHIEDRVE
jgi:hypothetical protein